MERLSIGAIIVKALLMGLVFTIAGVVINFFKKKREKNLTEQSNKPSMWATKENGYSLAQTSKTCVESIQVDLNGSQIGAIKEPLEKNNFKEAKFYEIIAQELDEKRLIKPLWTKAFASADGDYNKAKANYINLRFSQLMQEESELREREKIQEEEKFINILNIKIDCYGYKTLGDLFDSAKKYGGGSSPKYSHAKYLLGKIYQEGKWITRDFESAKRWLIRSAGEGYEPAISELAKIEMKLLGNSQEANDRIHIWSNDSRKRDSTRKCWKCGDIYHGSEYVKCLKCNLYLMVVKK
jgi:hypothetical protein